MGVEANEESVGGIVYAVDAATMAAMAVPGGLPAQAAEAPEPPLVFFPVTSVVRVVALASPMLRIAPGCPAIGMSQAEGRPITVLLFGADPLRQSQIIDAVLCQVGGQHFAIAGGRIAFAGRVQRVGATGQPSFDGKPLLTVDLPALYARVEANVWSKRAQSRAAWSHAVSQRATFKSIGDRK